MSSSNKKKSKNNIDSLCIRFACSTMNDLPSELLKLILECLRGSVGDLIRIGAVCTSWKILADSITDEQRRQQHVGPFVLFRPVRHKHDHTIYSLFDFYKNRSHHIVVPDVDTSRFLVILNSWNEWILTFTCAFNGCMDDTILCLNLLSKEEIEIPCIKHVTKVIISSRTPLDPNCIFMALFGNRRKLAFYQNGGKNKNWNRLVNKEFGQGYQAIVYFKGEFYAVKKYGTLVVLRDIDNEVKVLKVASSVVTRASDFLYLVESCGDLFLIIRTFRLQKENARMKFEAYKLNSSRGMWEKVESLGDDDSAFFIGYHMSLSVSAKDFPVKKDCIYFTTSTNDSKTQGRDVFNLNTNQFESSLINFS